MEPSPELMAAIAAKPEAQAQWDILTKTNKFAICFRLASLKTEAGRQKRLAAFVDMLARGETIQPQKRVREPVETATSTTASRASPLKLDAHSDVRRSRRLRKA